jgi:pimeloyl-ACP methyl ester carboxylesterase
MRVYFIPGLAADSRVFHRIQLPEGHEAVHLDWLDPLPKESLSGYARRMGERVESSTPFALVGLSFGGMLVTEIAKQKRPERLILLSSIPRSSDLPPYFKSAGRIKLDQAVPVGLIKKGIILRRIFSRNGREDETIIRDIVDKSDPSFISWAMRAILEWEGQAPDQPYIQIHGSRDIVLPIRYTRPTHVVRGAGHLMVMDRADQINEIFREILG